MATKEMNIQPNLSSDLLKRQVIGGRCGQRWYRMLLAKSMFSPYAVFNLKKD